MIFSAEINLHNMLIISTYDILNKIRAVCNGEAASQMMKMTVMLKADIAHGAIVAVSILSLSPS